jgi:sugar fermentation stimulation protein A
MCQLRDFHRENPGGKQGHSHLSTLSKGTKGLSDTALKITGTIEEAIFLRRLTRFSCLVKRAEQEIEVHFPNSGRHRELLVEGHRVLLRQETRPGRKTNYDLIMVRHGSCLVSVDARVPNRILGRALDRFSLSEFTQYRRVLHEVRWGESRLDFLLLDGGLPQYIEVKSVTLIQDGQALFPDAPTSRGRRHLRELMAIAASGAEAANVFVIQRDDAESFAPHDQADPEYGQLLRQAAREGVRILAYKCCVSENQIRLKAPVPISLS